METNQPAAKFQDASIAPMHTTEHILNQTMVRMFGCKRSKNAHIERKKSKCDYQLQAEPTAEQIAAIEEQVNKIISSRLDVTTEYTTRDEIPLLEVEPGISSALTVVFWYSATRCGNMEVKAYKSI